MTKKKVEHSVACMTKFLLSGDPDCPACGDRALEVALKEENAMSMTKEQKAVIVKGFRLLQSGAAEGEKIARGGDAEVITEHVGDMMQLLAEMQKGLSNHIASKQALAIIEERRPKVAAKVGRPKLRVVK